MPNMERSCPACGGAETTSVFEAHEFKHLRCDSCGLIFLLMPPRLLLQDYYQNATQKLIEKYIREQSPLLAYFLKFPLFTNFNNYLSSLINKSRAKKVARFARNGKTILDVGCASGGFLAEMQRLGWDIRGIEPGEDLADLAGKKVGEKNIVRGVFEKSDSYFESDTFDVITFWQVFEHIDDLRSTMRVIRTLLVNNGTLVLEVPHSLSTNFKIFGESWTLLAPPHHLHFWCARSLTRLLQTYGMYIVKIEYPVHFPFLFASSLVKKYRIALLLTPLLVPISIIWSALCSMSKKGDVIRVYATVKQE